jgi:hypothetical protein
MAAEKSRYAAEDQADAHAATAAQASAAPPEDPAAELRSLATTLAASKPKSRIKVAAAAAPILPPHEPLVLAQAQAEQVAAAPPVANATPAPAPEQTSLLAKTLDIKDHVVHATLHVVSAIGSIPSWVASMGDRISGGNASSNSGMQQFASSSS